MEQKRGFFAGVSEFVAQHRGFSFVVIVLTLFLVMAMFSHPPQVTTAQADQRFLASQQQEKATRIQQAKNACAIRKLCRQYTAARQQCATAGSYEKCMSIKIESPFSPQAECTTDGKVRYPLDDGPSELECLVYSVE